MMVNTLPELRPPEGGRLLLRATSEATLLVGVLHLPDSLMPDPQDCTDPLHACLHAYGSGAEEGARLTVGLHCTSVRPPVERRPGWGEDLFDWALRPEWWESAGESAFHFDLRVVRAMAQDHAWTVLGVLPCAGKAAKQSHRWVDVDALGRLHKIDPPGGVDCEGMALRQIARDLAVWPDRAGKLHTLPTVTPQRARLQQFANLLRGLAAAGHLCAEGMEAARRNIPDLAEITRGSVRDPDYEDHLADLVRAGLLQPEGAVAAEDRARLDAAIEDLITARHLAADHPRREAAR